jgi:hypothetical protein
MAGSLAAFFAPRSVAVIGASRDPSKVGGSVLANLEGRRLRGPRDARESWCVDRPRTAGGAVGW